MDFVSIIRRCFVSCRNLEFEPSFAEDAFIRINIAIPWRETYRRKPVEPSVLRRAAESKMGHGRYVDSAGSQTLYLSAIMDLFNNEIVAFHISSRNDNALVLNTVRKALEKKRTCLEPSFTVTVVSSTRPMTTITC